MNKLRLASLWLDGCSGCHMSLLDLDQGIAELAARIELVYSPLVDIRTFPEGVDVTLIEGAVGHDRDVRELLHIRQRTRTLVAFGDCAVTANVPGMRNVFPVSRVLHRAYVENSDGGTRPPGDALPGLLPQARPLHEIVDVDIFLPGCPPPTAAIAHLLASVLEGGNPTTDVQTRFGA